MKEFTNGIPWLLFKIFMIHLTTTHGLDEEEIETEFVTIRSLSMRSLNGERRLHVRAFGDDRHLLLKPSNVLSSSFRVVTVGGGPEKNTIISSPVPSDVTNNGQFYSVAGNTGSLYVKDGDEISVEGILDHNLFITPIDRHPRSTANHVVRRYPSKRSFFFDHLMLPNYPWRMFPISFFRQPLMSRRQSPPSAVTVEILMVFDYVNSQALGFDNTKLTTYAGIFLNSANHVYADTKDPSVSLSVAGIVITANTNDQPYISSNSAGDNKIYDSVLNSFHDWINEKRSTLPSFDDAVLLTGLNAGQNVGGTWTDTLVGLSYVGGACNQGGFNTAFVEDKVPSFTGVLTAAHEIAHTLNVPHDGDDAAASCPYTDGYRMGSPATNPVNAWKFSSCSLSIMKSFVKSNDGSCTWNAPNSSLPTTLPFYDSSSLDDQCKARFDSNFVFAGKLDDAVCGQFWCSNDGGKSLQSTGGAIEGTPCGTGKVCLNGVCGSSSVPSLDNQCVALFGQGYSADQKNSPDICKQLNCVNGGSKQTKGGATDGSTCGNYGICKQTQCENQVLSADDQCKLHFGQNYHAYTKQVIFGNNDICQSLWCTQDDRSLTSRGAADPNTSCGPGKICQNKSCVNA